MHAVDGARRLAWDSTIPTTTHRDGLRFIRSLDVAEQRRILDEKTKESQEPERILGNRWPGDD